MIDVISRAEDDRGRHISAGELQRAARRGQVQGCWLAYEAEPPWVIALKLIGQNQLIFLKSADRLARFQTLRMAFEVALAHGIPRDIIQAKLPPQPSMH